MTYGPHASQLLWLLEHATPADRCAADDQMGRAASTVTRRWRRSLARVVAIDPRNRGRGG
ncbi:hypothetical protein AB0J80_35570 [Actinoplanes sp. NPDC049548]|uniref:hypothetical protein n=1 Tax=Actinoplanes sp. NPDC049548 TaxID=3155152 RepID=UPI0034205A25